MEIRLEGRTAIVTGGGTGLGLGFAKTLAEAGAAVAITGRRQEPLDAAAKAIEQAGGKALAIQCDQRSRDQVEAAVARTVEWQGKVDILVNNAGIYPPCPFLAIEEEQWLDVMDTNINGPFRFAQACARIMSQNGWGRIINILSPSALLGFGIVNAYGTSKGGLGAMTRGLAAELGPMGITANSLTPGVSATEKFVELYSEFGVTLMSKGLPLARACEHEDTQAVLLLLASDQGSYITGATINVDGGMTSTFSSGG
ncbi:MAG: SDR family oxidoreductase [Deltaproteobacteria bacterium]|jgi:gluconate 5-dehydrogenase|nr:SDR family oxidoreductase [Deltaproteobacteria bacterium]MBW2385000.1 SDR family oxidoreductase [Deltaproteobacteria bacterium]MBW2697377.1 SDR family oxidoreductase [Deltaproteobacteria bacterium]